MKLRRNLFTGALLITLALSALPAQAAPSAQAEGVIAYGQTVSGEITEEVLEQVWTFKGAAGDMISILVVSNDENGLDATLTLKDGAGAYLASIDDVFVFDPFFLTRLESDGQYTITVSRSGGADGSSVGGYDLTLAEVALTELATPTTLTLAEGDTATYTVIEAPEAQAVVLDYEVTSGDARPDVSISYFEVDSDLEMTWMTQAVQLTGETVSRATVTLELPQPGFYLVMLERSWFDWGDTTGEFVVTVSPAQG